MKISKNFKKSEVVIYAIALMLVTAGYFNYTTNVENVSGEVYSENVAEIDKNEKKNDKKEDEEDIGDAKLVNSDVQQENKEESKKTDVSKSPENLNAQSEESEQTDAESQDSEIKTNVEPQNSEAKPANAESQDSKQKADDNDYFASTKLERETNYATSISNYTKILEDSSVSNTEKAIAMKEITKINNTKNAISVCENILLTKGFEKVIVLVNDKSVNVVVKSQGLNAKSVAQIQNIVSRELNTNIANIHITENSK